MKKALALFMLLMMLCSCVPVVAEGELTMKDLNTTDSFVISLQRMARLSPPNTMQYRRYSVQQGAATDGEYAYTILENQAVSLCSVWKVNLSDWSVVDTRYELELDHGNDMAYNPVLNQLIAVHNKPRYSMISFIDPQTLEVVESKTLSYQIYSMAYEPVRGQYVIGISGS